MVSGEEEERKRRKIFGKGKYFVRGGEEEQRRIRRLVKRVKYLGFFVPRLRRRISGRRKVMMDRQTNNDFEYLVMTEVRFGDAFIKMNPKLIVTTLT